MTISVDIPNLAAPLRPLAETAAQFHEECAALDGLVQDLYRDIEQLRDELFNKSQEIEFARRHLEERTQELASERQESSQLVHLLEQQELRVAEALGEIKALREQLSREREDFQQREAARVAFLEQKLRLAESEREEMRQQVHLLQASAASGEAPSSDSLAALMAELGNTRRQVVETQSQLADTRMQLTDAIERAAAAHIPAPAMAADGAPPNVETQERLATLERERIELESELELVRTRATELQEVVAQQRRELVEQRADVTTELRLLRELVEARPKRSLEEYEPDDDSALVGAASRSDMPGAAPDPVVSSVMAQFARLQKDVAQRRKKK